MIQTLEYRPEHEGDFLGLYRACLAHYGIAPTTAAEEQRIVDLLNGQRHMSCVMAYHGPTPVGFATWTLTFPAGSGVALYMKEIFVTRSARGLGAGRALLATLLARAKDEGCTRMDWQTDGSNMTSQAFYARIGAQRFDKQSYRILSKDFERFHARLTTVSSD